MSIPDFQSLMLPVLKLAARSETRINDAVVVLGNELGLSSAELEELLPSGKQTTFANRVNWAKSYLGKAGLVILTKRAHFIISDLGRKVLEEGPSRIDIKFLSQFENFQIFKSDRGSTTPQVEMNDGQVTADLTPDEQIRAASDRLEAELAAELLSRIVQGSPAFFERLVVNLLISMGYGGSAQKAGRALGKTGDGGVDGVIDEDVLGLDRIYVQAKRYATENAVGASDIRDFFGALDQFKAGKGLFVTTSRFSDGAKKTVEKLSKRIVLIDGVELTRLMITHGVGCRVEETILIKKLDEEFFE